MDVDVIETTRNEGEHPEAIPGSGSPHDAAETLEDDDMDVTTPGEEELTPTQPGTSVEL